MPEDLLPLLEDRRVVALTILLGAVVAALALNLVLTRWVALLTRKTKTELDDQLLSALKRPLFVSVILLGVAWASLRFQLDRPTAYVLDGVLKTLAVFIWSTAGMRLGSALLQALSRHAGKVALVQPRTLPLFEILVKVLVIGGAVYFAFLAWEINVTGWLASAGIVGIAVGFAAKDTLANLFAGFFILADAPYKLGDFILLESGLRGKVTDIGIRSTRVLTRDDIEVTIPNAVIANSKIINETGGPWEKERVRVKVVVAYGSDVDQVKQLLLACAAQASHVCAEPTPRVRFRSFGDSGLDLELLAWIDEPVLRGRVIDDLNTRVYKALGAAGVEIPYPKRDVYLHNPAGRGAPGGEGQAG